MLRANEEVEDGIVSFLREQVRVRALDESAVAAARSVELALQQYEKGLINYQPVLDTQRTLVQSQDSVTESRALVAADLVAVYRAIGGGWTSRLMEPEGIQSPMPAQPPAEPNHERIPLPPPAPAAPRGAGQPPASSLEKPNAPIMVSDSAN